MPRELSEAVDRRAKLELTNKSDIIRRALLAFLPPAEAARIRQMVIGQPASGSGKSAAPKFGKKAAS